MTFGDHFSGQAGDYARFRPTYPEALGDWLGAIAPRADRVWEVGAGSGQASAMLGRRFRFVVATEPSFAQLAQGTSLSRAAAGTAECSPLAARSVDLVVAAQAAHWFDMRRFAAEVRRVAREGASVALWSYGLVRVGRAVDEVIDDYHRSVVGPWWPRGREHVDAGYATLDFPFTEEAAPSIDMIAAWTLDHFVGYLESWSALGRCRRETGSDPLPPLVSALRERWGPVPEREVRWPLAIRWAKIRGDEEAP